MGTPKRVAAFFRTKRAGMLVANIRDNDLDLLVATIKEAKAAGRGIVCFLFNNTDRPQGPVAGLTVDVEREQQEGGWNGGSQRDSGGGSAGPVPSGGGSRGGFRGRKPSASTTVAKNDPLDGLFGGKSADGKEPGDSSGDW